MGTQKKYKSSETKLQNNSIAFNDRIPVSDYNLRRGFTAKCRRKVASIFRTWLFWKSRAAQGLQPEALID